MFNKLVDVLKEVFWLKKSTKKSKRTTSKKKVIKTPKKTVKKKAVKPVVAPKVKKPAPAPKPIKAAVKQASAPKAAKPAKTPKDTLDPALKPIGEITHYFDRIKVAVVKINQGTILIGDRLTIVSAKHKFVQKIWSMQIESLDVKVAKKGQLIGIKIDKPVVPGDIVYK